MSATTTPPIVTPSDPGAPLAARPSRWARWRLTREQLIASVIGGLLFGVAFPPFALYIPIFLCLVPLAIAVARVADDAAASATLPARSPGWTAARMGMLFALVGYGINVYWIAVALLLYTPMALAGYLGSLVWIAPFVGMAAAALYAIRRRWRWPLAIALPIVWIALEFAFNYLSDLSFPWLPLGLSVARTPVLAQFADVSGVRGVSFWIAAINGLVADAWIARGTVAVRTAAAKVPRAIAWRLGGAFLILAAAELYGEWRMTTIPLTHLANVAVVQPNIPQRDKLKPEERMAHVSKLTEMTRATLRGGAGEPRPDLVVWPEAALDGFFWQFPTWADSLRAAVAEHPTPLLAGVLDSNSPLDSNFRYYNAAIITDSLGVLGAQPAYHKQFLVPIVERVPFLNPAWFQNVNYFGGFGRGESQTPFTLPFGGAGVLICYESIYPQLSRAYAKNGATLLVNITNDAWFQRSLAPYQHFAHLPLRAIETRLPAVRAANTGISAYVDPLGRVRSATGIFEPFTGTYAVERTTVTTLYVRWGDWIGTLCLVVTLAASLTALVVGRTSRRQTA